jgi:predicted dinucleotide-binding enzyme
MAIEFVSFVGNQGEALCHRFAAKVPESVIGEKEGEQEEVMKSFAKWLPGCARL